MSVKCKAEESLTCSCVDVGTIIDGSDCTVNVDQTFPSQADAEQAFARMRCSIESTFYFLLPSRSDDF